MSIFLNSPNDINKRFLLTLDLKRCGDDPELKVTPDYIGYKESELEEVRKTLRGNPAFERMFADLTLISDYDADSTNTYHISPYLKYYKFNTIPVSVSSALAKEDLHHYTYTIDILPLNITLLMHSTFSFSRVDTFMRKLHDLFMELHFKKKKQLNAAPTH